MDQNVPPDLLEASHVFPGVYRIKAIGSAEDDFEGRVLGAVRLELASPDAVEFTVRQTAGGRHVALTLDVTVRDAEHVRSVYARIREQKGLLFLL
jgi:putative lipoic acid-binding regulatory protein